MLIAAADQIKETNIQYAVVSCPICAIMLDAAMTSRGYDIKVIDIAQLIKESIV